MNEFFAKLEARWRAGARVCVGLDPELARIPAALRNNLRDLHPQFTFNQRVMDATADIALAWKFNSKFYPGERGLESLGMSYSYARRQYPHVPLIDDSKYVDIGKTLRGLVEQSFRYFGADAATVVPYPGGEALKPFLDRAEKGIIVLCRTSNPGAGEFQDLEVRVVEEGVTMIRSFYEQVARAFSKTWNVSGNCALVVGATAPEQLARVRAIVADMWLLIPGIGAQEGDLEAVLKNGLNSRGSGVIINSSSGIIFAPEGPRAATLKLTREINAILQPRPLAA
jgi:orotidine-5'-phosphate decarboxylase